MGEHITLQFDSNFYTRIPKDLILKYFNFLIKTFKHNYSTLFLSKITNEADLLFLIHLSRSLQRVVRIMKSNFKT